MDRTDVLNQLKGIIEDTLDLEDLEITEATTAGDIEDWDSLAHVQIIVGIEKQFGVKFGSLEIEQFQSVGDIINGVTAQKA